MSNYTGGIKRNRLGMMRNDSGGVMYTDEDDIEKATKILTKLANKGDSKIAGVFSMLQAALNDVSLLFFLLKLKCR